MAGSASSDRRRSIGVVPDVVVAELVAGRSREPSLQLVLDSDWIVTRALVSDEERAAFAYFSSLMVVGERNIGEAGVLAYAKVHAAVAIIDDGYAA
jgi:hypothetical protein